MPESSYVLKMEGISKSFSETIANDRVNFDLRPSEIHVLLGENGAGKTTLMNILFGHLQGDSGSIHIGEQQVDIKSPHDAINHGIGMVHQHFTLVPSFTVAENVMLGVRKVTDLAFKTSEVEAAVDKKAKELHMPIDPSVQIRDLPTDLQQRVEIIKALYRGAQILIMDEPTSLLGPRQVENLLKILSDLRDSGHSIVLVTHKLAEVVEVADRVTVLRKGKRVASIEKGEFDETSLAQAMTGHEREKLPDRIPILPSGERFSALEVRNLVVSSAYGEFNAVDKLSFQIQPGEILGFAGVEGNGQREIVDSLIGLTDPTSGEVFIAGRDVTHSPPLTRRQYGLGAIPEDRQGLGLVLDMTIGENLVISDVISGRYSKFGLVRWKKARNGMEELLTEYDVRPPDPTIKVSSLSGGNQQKVVLAREMSSDPSILIADNPTWGLDVGAIDYVHKRILELRSKDVGVLLLTLDLEELFKLSDRVLVLYRGKKVLEDLASEINDEQLSLAMVGGSLQSH